MRRSSLLNRALVASAVAVAVPQVAKAAGFDIPENGAVILSRGGTAVSSFGTAYALQFNPAGLTGIDGLDVRIDGRLVSQGVTFERAPSGNSSWDAVSNSAGLFFGPSVAIGYSSRKLFDGRLGLGLGVWGPPGVGKYAYPDPAAVAKGACLDPSQPDVPQSACINVATGQRYTLIDQNILIMFPSVGASWKFTDRLSVGVTLQDAITLLQLRQSIAAVSLGGLEDSTFDATIKLDLKDTMRPTGILGVAFSPTEHLRIGASFRPQVNIEASGKMDIGLPAAAAALNTKVVGDTASLKLQLPPVVKVGATWIENRWSASAELTYEGWSALDKMVLSPDVKIQKGTEEPEAIAPIEIHKEWKDAFGARIGGSFTALEWEPKKPMLELHAGALYAANTIPSSTQAIDFVTGDHLAGSLGATFHTGGGLAFTLGGMVYAPVKLEVTDSTVARAAAEPESPPVIVGNGTYQSTVWIATFGVAYTGLGSAPAPAAVEPAPAAAPAPAAETTPAAAPAAPAAN